MEKQIRNILDKAGYNDMPATEDGLINCFLDYVDSGVFGNMTTEEAIQDIKDGDIAVKDIIANMKRL